MKQFVYILLIFFFGLIGWISTTELGVKSQVIRLGDVLLYGPLLIYISTQVDKLWIKIVLLFIGSTTITYNFVNFIQPYIKS